MLPCQALLLLCHLDNDLGIIKYIYGSIHDFDLHKPYRYRLPSPPGDISFSRYPSVALARN